jgi:nucleoside-diphosphate-sugar epimerase
MSKVIVTGSTGFVGKNLVIYLASKFFQVKSLNLRNERWESEIDDQTNVIIHLAGKAHDLKNTSSPNEYYQVNTELTKKVFDAFLSSDANVFITLSSVKAVADEVDGELIEQQQPNPKTHYGKSKLLAEEYIFSKKLPDRKRVFILRPCMIHGLGNQGNLNLLYQFVSKHIPWPLGAFENMRSFCSIENLMFVINEIIQKEDMPSGIYNVADDDPISTNELIELIARSQNRKSKIWNIPKGLNESLASIGDKLHLPYNSDRLHKLTSSYVVSNSKIKAAIGKSLPVSSREGLMKTFESFQIC